MYAPSERASECGVQGEVVCELCMKWHKEYLAGCKL